MPTTTFENLKDQKRAVITNALITEFSEYSLKDAQVARIIKTAGIARGTFYKYFSDITDAYNYVFHLALADFHMGFNHISEENFNLDAFIASISTFIDQVVDSRFYQLLKQHYLYNESSYQQHTLSGMDRITNLSPLIWTVATLSHEAIKELLVFPGQKNQIIQKLTISLKNLT
ncbi:TetR/AcrR family transcriptional regulator [Lentilactobacillus kosonis]|uniref:Transcriptional regulator, TetR family n=1 Tax=Lentilactobacillus kosonis TaxID=2810561 RepID=A0A401FMB0_9LACO|nr:TetR/AcrR family transcriptional regulator [Lentilactobacillus kosonis]GAY73398.1 transcriptional regulator, TetR family [Lentilactobacillus kosonis]